MEFALTKNKRSPLKERPLRIPGQSLDEQIRDEIQDYIAGPVLFALFIVVFAALEWFRYFRPYAPSPLLYSIVAVIAAGFAAYRSYQFWPRLRALKLARDGETEVGQNLESLRAHGYQVFHDVVGDGFNIDHVLIGPAGIFTVETKTHSKRPGNPSVVFDGDKILIDGLEPDRNPVVQAKSQASWVRALLSESTGHMYYVRPVIVYPGWFVENRGPWKKTIWVINPKGLPTFLEHEPVQLNPEEVKLASFHLTRFVRGGFSH